MATAIYVSDPLPGKTHDAKAFTETPVADIIAHSGGAIGDKGYRGHVIPLPLKKPRGGQLSKSDIKCNAEISALRAPIERVVAHFKSWRMLPHRLPSSLTTPTATRTTPPEDCSSSQLYGVLNNAPSTLISRSPLIRPDLPKVSAGRTRAVM